MNTEAITAALTAKHSEQRTITNQAQYAYDFQQVHASLGAELAYEHILAHLAERPDINLDTLIDFAQTEADTCQRRSDSCHDRDSRQHWSGFAGAYTKSVQIINETELKPA